MSTCNPPFKVTSLFISSGASVHEKLNAFKRGTARGDVLSSLAFLELSRRVFYLRCSKNISGEEISEGLQPWGTPAYCSC